MERTPLGNNIQNTAWHHYHIIRIGVLIFRFDFLTDGINMGEFLLHLLGLQFNILLLAFEHQIIMAPPQLSGAIYDLIIYIHVQFLCHGKIILPCTQYLMAVSPERWHLTPHIVIDLHHAHAVGNELDIPGLNILLIHPQKDIIRDFPAGALFILQPPQQITASIMEPKALKPSAVKSQGFDQAPCTTVFDKFTDRSAGTETFSGKLRQARLADLFHLRYPFEHSQIFFRINAFLLPNPVDQPCASKFLLFQSWQCFAIDPSIMRTRPVVRTGGSGNPTHIALLIQPPIVGSWFSFPVINRAPDFLAIKLGIWKAFFSVCPVSLKFTNYKANFASLDQVGKMFFCLHIPRSSIGFEYHRMAATTTAAFLIVMWMYLDRYFLFAVGTITCFGAALFVVVVNVILPDGNLIHPSTPVLRKFRHLFHIFIPWISFPPVPLFELFIAHIPLKLQDGLYRFFINVQICLYRCLIFLADPVGFGIPVLPLPVQSVQLGFAPFLYQAVIGNKLPLFFIQIHFIGRITPIQAKMLWEKESHLQYSILFDTSQIGIILTDFPNISVVSFFLSWQV